MKEFKRLSGKYKRKCPYKPRRNEMFIVEAENNGILKIKAVTENSATETIWTAKSEKAGQIQYPIILKYKYAKRGKDGILASGRLYISPDVNNARIFVYGECESHGHRIPPFCYVLEHLDKSEKDQILNVAHKE